MKCYYTLAVRPKAEGQQWSPQFGDYDREVVAQELEDTKADWTKGSRFKIIKTGDKQADINAAIDALNREEFARDFYAACPDAKGHIKPVK